MTSAIKGAGTQLRLRLSTDPLLYGLIAEVTRIGPIGTSASEIDVTSLDSTTKEYIAGLPEGATVEFDFNWTQDAEQILIRDAVGTTEHIQVVWPDSTQAEFDMTVLGFSLGETTSEGALVASASGRISGSITWT